MRIITGKYKGRHFDIPRTFKARPTTDFAKENIFNVLTGYTDFEDCAALDLFAGTGSISLELLSRGCDNVTSVELDRDHYRFICECVNKLSVPTSAWRGIKGDVFRFLKTCKQQYDIIFADPPYALHELPQIPDLVLGIENLGGEANSSLFTLHSSLLKPDGVFVFEHGKDHDFSQHPRFVEHRQYGSVNFSLFR
jgi:16S rRNA (guanine(966)-N(2))-methyltransferase RsmD